jgi:hypothetical protein
MILLITLNFINCLLINMLTVLLFSCLFILSYQQKLNAYCTYHLYTPSTDLSGLSCSDGKNGLLSWGYFDLKSLYPYVTAWEQVSWNSPHCGDCIKMIYNQTSIYLTVVDQCGKSPVINTNHFDMGPDAFNELFGAEGSQKGHMEA